MQYLFGCLIKIALFRIFFLYKRSYIDNCIFVNILVFCKDIPGEGWGGYPGILDAKVISN